MVLAANALEATYVGFNGDDWVHHKGWIKASRLSDWHGITVLFLRKKEKEALSLLMIPVPQPLFNIYICVCFNVLFC